LFAEEFPDFLHLNKIPEEGCPRTCTHVFDAFLAHCESRVAKNDMATVTLASYRKILNSIWRPQIGAKRFLSVLYSTLVKVADDAHWSKKTYNNAISVLRCAFRFGYRDYPNKHDPVYSLRSARIQKKDRTRIDHIASGTLKVNKACVAGVDKDSTKTGEGGESKDTQASRHFGHFNGQKPSSACPIGRANRALQDRSGAPRLFVSEFASGHPLADGNPRNNNDFDWW
jgi:hypothetical protein